MEVFALIGAVILCGLIVKLSEWWDGRKDSSGPKYIHPDDIHSEPELNTVTPKKMPHVDMETTKTIDLKSENNMEQTIGTRDLFMETLTKIGCQYELADEEGDNRIFFAYQGEHFFADTTNEGWYVHVWDTHWGHVELYDVEEFTRLKKAINIANLNCATITVYTIDEAGSNVDVHCKSTFPFLQQIPNLKNYLRGELNDFFRAHQYVGNEMAKMREEEERGKS